MPSGRGSSFVLSFSKDISYRVCSVLFVIICITINLTIDKNPFVFPVLSGDKKVEIVTTGLYRSFSDKSGDFVTKENLYINKPTGYQQKQLDEFLQDESTNTIKMSDGAFSGADHIQTVYKLKSGQKLNILGVRNFGGIDSTNQNYIVTDIGQFSQRDIDNGLIKISTKNIQSKWAEYLGDLMYWPVFPILLISSLRNLK